MHVFAIDVLLLICCYKFRTSTSGKLIFTLHLWAACSCDTLITILPTSIKQVRNPLVSIDVTNWALTVTFSWWGLMPKVSTGRFLFFSQWVIMGTAVPKQPFAFLSSLGIPVTCHSESCCIILGRVVNAYNLSSVCDEETWSCATLFPLETGATTGKVYVQ